MNPSPDLVAFVKANAGDQGADLVLAIIEHESSFNPRAFANDRNGGSYGLMQLDLATARNRGFTGDAAGLYDPKTNVRLGIAQLRWIDAFLRSHNVWTVNAKIAAYNEGAGAAARGNADIHYVQAVQSARRRWEIKLAEGSLPWTV